VQKNINPLPLPYSTETAIDEFNKEKVDRIILLVGASDAANMTRFGHGDSRCAE
jgi:hypothetical protein